MSEEIFDADFLLKMLKDKEQVFRTLVGDGNQAMIIHGELDQTLKERFDDEDDPEVLKAWVKSLMKVNRRQATTLTHLLTIMLVYVQSDTFTSDVGKALVKLGRGEEALQEMFKQKTGE